MGKMKNVELEMTGGYGRSALQEAFDTIADKSDWRAPISAKIWTNERDIMKTAIEFFTATTPKFESDPDDSALTVVTAVGYRAGPAGP